MQRDDALRVYTRSVEDVLISMLRDESDPARGELLPYRLRFDIQQTRNQASAHVHAPLEGRLSIAGSGGQIVWGWCDINTPKCKCCSTYAG